MSNDYAAKLREYGVALDTDLHDTSSAFCHEIFNLHQPEGDHALLYESLQVQQQLGNLNSLVYSEVTCSPTASLDQGVEVMLHHWLTQLRYQRPRYESIEVTKMEQSAAISCITISMEGGSACTFTFMVHQHPDFVEQDELVELTREQQDQMLETMDATFDGPVEDMIKLIKPALCESGRGAVEK